MKIRAFIFTGLFLAIFMAAPQSARAFCVENKVMAPIHIQSLSRGGFGSKVRANGRVCGKTPKDQKLVTVLVVIGYEPVTESGRPGWKGQCRAQIPPDATVVVTGRGNEIKCTRKR